MQVLNSVNSQTSFGIKSVTFNNWDNSKPLFDKAIKKIKPEKIKEMWLKVSDIKPKVGPDVDVFVGSEISKNYLFKPKEVVYLYSEGNAKFEGIGNTTRSIKKAFQKLVDLVDKDRLKDKALNL